MAALAQPTPDSPTLDFPLGATTSWLLGTGYAGITFRNETAPRRPKRNRVWRSISRKRLHSLAEPWKTGEVAPCTQEVVVSRVYTAEDVPQGARELAGMVTGEPYAAGRHIGFDYTTGAPHRGRPGRAGVGACDMVLNF